MKKVLLIISFAIVICNLCAQTPFLYNGIYYISVSETTAEVTNMDWMGAPVVYESATTVIDSVVIDTLSDYKEYHVTGIGAYCFLDCKNITSITLPATLQYIGMNGFQNCIGLTQIDLPEGLTMIADQAFYACSSIKEFIIPSTIETIGANCFGGFGSDADNPGSSYPSQLERIFIKATTPPSITSPITDVEHTPILYVPADYYSTYADDPTYSTAGWDILPFAEGKVNVLETAEPDSLVFTCFKYPDVDEYIVTFKIGDDTVAQYSIDDKGNTTKLFLPPKRIEEKDTTKNTTEMFVISLGNVQSNTTYSYSVNGINKARNENVYRTSGTFRIGDAGLKQEQTAVAPVVYYTVSVVSDNITMGTVSGGGKIESGEKISITATPNTHYRFVQWNDGNTSNPRSITITQDTSFTAQFEAVNFTVSTDINDQTMGSVSGAGTFIEGSVVALTATPNTHYRFVQWSDGNKDNPRDITLTKDTLFTAQFEAVAYKITCTVTPQGAGTVDGQGEYKYLSDYTLTLTPAEGYELKEWRDGTVLENEKNNTLTRTTLGNTNIEVVLQLKHYTITTAVNDDKMGTVTGAGDYEHGSTVTLTATPNSGYRFVNWNSDATENPLQFIATNNSTITANFEAIPQYTVTFVDHDGSILKTETVEEGKAATAPADPKRDGYTFTGWEPADFSKITSNTTITAQYSKDVVVYTVTFVDWDDTKIIDVKVIEGNTATAPEDPEREGYTFIGWDKDLTNVQSDLTVKAQYEENIPDYTPQNLKVVIEPLEEKNMQITFSWDAVEDVQSYELQLLYDGQSLYTTNISDKHEITITLSELLKKITGLMPGTYTLDWQVRSIDALGDAISDYAQGEQFEIIVPLQTSLDKNQDSNTKYQIQKIIHNGEIYIIRNNDIFTTNGQRVK